MGNFLISPLKKYFYIPLAVFLVSSCTKLDVFEKNAEIPGQKWQYNNAPTFTFAITDTTASYSISIVLRHTDAYQYNNIWLKVGSRAPGDSMHYQNVDIPLGSDSKGWNGNGMDDIFEFRKNITPGPVPFKMPGNYTFTIAQIMRENPLPHILSIGLRVEKVNAY
ncbi:MAG: gliding motility lipoprotein GldH [Ginsengibacter sp.]